MEPQQGSEFESDDILPNSKLSIFINKITKMSKNPSVDSELSQVLDNFLEKLSVYDKYLENGIFSMNFAEAALLVQCSADLYSKKVDLLWDVILDYQKRLLLSEEQNDSKEQEIEKLEERKRKYKRKRKTNADESQTAKLVNNFSFGNTENWDYLNQDYETVSLSIEWEKFYTSKETNVDSHTSNKNSLFLPNNSIYTDENDYIGRYNQFHSASLIDEIFHLEKQKLLSDDNNCVTKMRIDCYVINDFLLERSRHQRSGDSDELNEYIKQFLESRKIPEKTTQPSGVMLQQLCYKKSYVSLERLPFNLIREKLRRTSLADSLFDDDHMSLVSGNCLSPAHSIEVNPKNMQNESFDHITGSVENRSKSCSQDSAFYEDVEESINNECDDVTENDNAARDVTQTETVTCNIAESENVTCREVIAESENITCMEDVTPIEKVTCTEDLVIETNNNVVQKSKTNDSKSAITNKQMCVGSSVIVTRHKVGRKWSSILKDSEEEEEIKAKKIKKNKISEKVLKKLATGKTFPYRDFEKFCRLQYKPESGEGEVPPQLSESEDSDEDEAFSDEENDRSLGASHYEQISDLDEDEEPEGDTSTEIPEVQNSLTSPICDLSVPSCSQTEDLPVQQESPPTPRRPQLPLSEADMEQEEILRKRVREWRSFIVPKLKSMENRSDFDIHEYGSKILDPSSIGDERNFKDIVRGKSSAEVARYFIATLQLANTYNVEITRAASCEVANDSFRIKTLDKTRYHEMLEEYQAPSEETFRERLEKVQAMNPDLALHSTPNMEPPIKKIKFDQLSQKKLF